MPGLTELEQFDAEVFRIETDTVWVGGEDGEANRQGKALANRTQWLKTQIEALGLGKQPLDAMLTALAALVTEADQMLYFTGADTPALTPLTAFIRTLLAAADAAAARTTIGAAPLDAPALTGIPTAPTAAPGTNTTQLANTAFVQAALAALVDSSPGSLDTLNELAAALGDDPNFAATIIDALALKAPLASPALTGAPTSPTAAPGTNTDQIASTAFIQAAIAALALDGYAKLAAANVFTKGQGGTVAALPATAGTLNFDFTGPSNISGQVTGDTVFGNGYTTHGAGKATWFCIEVFQSAGTLRNWAFASNWRYEYGNSMIPQQTQTAGAKDEVIGRVCADGTISFAVRSNVS